MLEAGLTLAQLHVVPLRYVSTTAAATPSDDDGARISADCVHLDAEYSPDNNPDNNNNNSSSKDKDQAAVAVVRNLVMAAAHDDTTAIIINFTPPIAQNWTQPPSAGAGAPRGPTPGHFSLLLGGHGQCDAVVEADVNRLRYGVLWTTSVARLAAAVAAPDSCGRARGFLILLRRCRLDSGAGKGEGLK